MKLSFRISIYLIKHKLNSKGVAPLWFRIKYNREEAQFSSGILVKPCQWDFKRNKVIKHLNATAYNIEIQNTLHELKELYHSYIEKNKEVSPKIIRNQFLNKIGNALGIMTHFQNINQKQTERLGTSVSFGTLKHYKSSLNKLERYINSILKKDDYPINDIDFTFLNSYETYLITHDKNKTNTVYNEMKRFKFVLNEAVNMGIITETPFKKYKLKVEDTEREVLDNVEVNTIRKEFNLNDFAAKAIAIDWLLFMIYTGLSYSDLKNLTTHNIINTIGGEKMISVNRQKTKRAALIPLFPDVQNIIDKYKTYPESVNLGTLMPYRSNQLENPRKLTP